MNSDEKDRERENEEAGDRAKKKVAYVTPTNKPTRY